MRDRIAGVASLACWVVLGFGLTACASVDVLRLTQQTFAPKASADEVDVLDHVPAQSYIELADLSMTDSSTGVERMQRKILKKAASLGADAVVFSKPQSTVEHQVAYDSPLGYGGFAYPVMGMGWGSPGGMGMGWGSPWGMGWGSPWGLGGWGSGSYAVPYDVTMTTLKGTAIRYMGSASP